MTTNVDVKVANHTVKVEKTDGDKVISSEVLSPGTATKTYAIWDKQVLTISEEPKS